MIKIADFLQKRSRFSLTVIGTTLILLIGSADYYTGTELSISVFYLIPVALMTWWISRRAGLWAACACALVWLLADLASGKTYSSEAIPYWNAGVRLSFFLIVTLILSSLREARVHQEELGHFIVHDLRSPLSNVVAGLQYLLDFTGETLDESQKELIQLSIAASNRMMTLVNALLDLGKLESGKLTLNTGPVEVSSVLETSVQQVAAMAARGEVNISIQIDVGAEMILADADLTTRVLVNLLSNALKYSPKDTAVEIHVKRHTSTFVAIQVVDRGAGIPKEWANRVFDKFAQVEARNAGIRVGSGLGLTFCRLTVEAQGGRIWLESEVGQGTTVTFTLPSPTPS